MNSAYTSFAARALASALLVVAVLAGLYLTTFYSYLLFHSLVEMLSIVVAFSIFVIAWNSRRFSDNNYLVVVGVAYLFIGFLDLIHTLAYKGMGALPGYDANLPTQLWIAARYLESISLLIAPILMGRKRLRAGSVLVVYSAVTALLWIAIFSGFFPDCFIEGIGLTPFKKASEYAVSLILIASMVLLWSRRERFDRDVLYLLVAAAACTVGAELAFTFYVSVYGLSNLIGHFLKLISFYLIYEALILTGIQRPADLLFRDLDQSRRLLQNELLERRRAEAALRESEERFRRLAENAQDIVYRFRFVPVRGFEYMSPAATTITGYTPEEHYADPDLGERIVHPDDRERLRKALEADPARSVTSRWIRRDGTTIWVDQRNVPVYDEAGNLVALEGITRDITELRDVLAQVRHLSGLLPICSSCKKIRDDNGYWEQVEVYVRDHSDAEFTHGLCPDCAKKLYPEYLVDDDDEDGLD